MVRRSCLTALGLASLALTALGARANSPSVTVTSPFYTSPLPTMPYWANPYWSQPYWANQATPGISVYSPGPANLPPQLTNRAANPYPLGAQTCVAPPYTCPAPAPNTPGHTCTCATSTGETVTGTVH